MDGVALADVAALVGAVVQVDVVVQDVAACVGAVVQAQLL